MDPQITVLTDQTREEDQDLLRMTELLLALSRQRHSGVGFGPNSGGEVSFWRPNEDQHFSIFDLHGIARQPTVHRIDSDAGVGDVKLPKVS